MRNRFSWMLLATTLGIASAKAADSALGFTNIAGFFDSGVATVAGLTTLSGGLTSTAGPTKLGATTTTAPVAQPALPGQTAPAITTPTSAGTAPSGALQLTAAATTITSCPTVTASQQNAVQITASTGQVQAIANQCTVPIYAYPVPGGTLGSIASQTANAPVRIDVGMVGLVTGLSATSAYIDVHTNFSWNDPSVTVSIPAIAANSCSFVSFTEAKARVGDRVAITDTAGSLVNSTITVSAIYNTATAGQVTMKICNVATLATSAATSPTVSVMGFGAI